MKKLVIDPPQEKQKLFFEAQARQVAYGGARAGGKSWAMRHKLVLLCFQYKGLQCLLVRRTLTELQENHITPLLILLNGIATYNRQEKVFSFPNGSRLKLGYCSAENDVLQYQGQSYDAIGMEEATQFTEFQYNCLRECNRSSGICKAPFSPRMYLTANPGGVGHGWFKRLFVDRNFREKEQPEDYIFIQANVYDNKVFMDRDPGYVAQLESLPEKRRRMMLLGEWDVAEGAFFEEFVNNPEHYKDRRWTHVIEPFEIQDGWAIYRSYDFGYAKPFSCAWWAVDYDGVIYRILELYGCTQDANTGVKWTPERQFEEIRKIESEHRWLKGKTILGVADPAIWDTSRGESIYETACKYRIYFDKGENRRVPGWMQVHYRMAFDDEGFPMMYVFNTCKGFIRTIPTLMYSSTHPEDLDTEGEDHIADETRYFCMSRPISPRMPKKAVPLVDDPLDQRVRYGSNNYFGR